VFIGQTNALVSSLRYWVAGMLMERTSWFDGSPPLRRVSIVLRAACAARSQSGWSLSMWSETAIAGTPMKAASIAAATVPE